MRNIRNVIIAFVIFASLVVTVGFAALVDNLAVRGEFSATPVVYDSSIYFTYVKSIKNCSVKISDDGDTATVHVFLDDADMVNGVATAEAVINVKYLVDFSEFPDLAGQDIPDVTLGECQITSTDTVHFKSNSVWDDGTTGKGPRTLSNGDEILLKVSVTVEEASVVDTDSQLTCSFDITIPVNNG
ncbi:MAG: hypothetical protein IJW21_06730 [Clostridia bacterium]|nr:hypothetical protein [Clostridia bacterium]